MGILIPFAVAALSLLSPTPASSVTMDWVTIGDPGNAPDTASNCYAAACGSVPYEYRIARYEVTNAQYAAFLNEKAADDPLGLYDPDNWRILRSGAPGNYSYSILSGYESRAADYISFFNALRFVNWLHNGQGSGDTEAGAYTLLGGTPTPSNGYEVTRNPGAKFFVPSENEWYKAAYYDPVAGRYFAYPTGSDTPPTCSLPTSAPNSANCGDATGVLGADVGSYPGSPSAAGTFDQAGGVTEWNEQIIFGFPSFRGMRGGHTYDQPFSFVSSARGLQDPTAQTSLYGLRVASAIPEPTTALLLGGGLLGLATRRLKVRLRSVPASSRSDECAAARRLPRRGRTTCPSS